MIVGYFHQPIPSEKLLASFSDAHLFVNNNESVINSLTDIVNSHTQQIQDVLKDYKAHGCSKCAIKSNQIKEHAWEEFVKTIPNKSYVIVSDYSQITDSNWKMYEIIKDALKKEIYILDFSNAMMAEITFDKAYAYYNKMVLENLEKEVHKQKARAQADRIIDLTVNKHTVNQIIDIVGCSRSTVFRVRREAGLKERFYNA
jgi:uncharacterized protein YerC